MLTISVKKICGQHCIGFESAAEVFKMIINALKSGKIVSLDFQDILTITSSFLNAAIGKLYKEFKEEIIEKNISFNNLDENDIQLVNLVKRNAIDHFAKKKSEKKRINDIVNKNIEENNNE